MAIKNSRTALYSFRLPLADFDRLEGLSTALTVRQLTKLAIRHCLETGALERLLNDSDLAKGQARISA